MNGIHFSFSYDETLRLGERFAACLKRGDKVILDGDLGAGKTAFTQGIAKGLGVKSLVTSPTFTIMNIYEGDITLFHFDMYRLDNTDEIYELGLDECLYGDDGVCVVEWNKFENLCGKVYTIKINRIDDEIRRISIDESYNN